MDCDIFCFNFYCIVVAQVLLLVQLSWKVSMLCLIDRIDVLDLLRQHVAIR